MRLIMGDLYAFTYMHFERRREEGRKEGGEGEGAKREESQVCLP